MVSARILFTQLKSTSTIVHFTSPVRRKLVLNAGGRSEPEEIAHPVVIVQPLPLSISTCQVSVIDQLPWSVPVIGGVFGSETVIVQVFDLRMFPLVSPLSEASR